MRYENINDLVSSSTEAMDYFNTLPIELQQAVMAHGDGINTMEEFKHFVKILKKKG